MAFQCPAPSCKAQSLTGTRCTAGERGNPQTAPHARVESSSCVNSHCFSYLTGFQAQTHPCRSGELHTREYSRLPTRYPRQDGSCVPAQRCPTFPVRGCCPKQGHAEFVQMSATTLVFLIKAFSVPFSCFLNKLFISDL